MFFSLVKRLHLDGSYIRSWLILAIDLAVSATATLVAFLGIDYFVRNSGFSLLHYLFLLVSAFFCSAVAFYIFRTYRTVIRHSSLREVWKLGAATLLKELLMLLILWFWPDGMTFKAIGLCVVLDLFVTVCMLITVRVLMILLYDAIILSHIRRTNRIRTLVYGVESKEVVLVMRLQNSPHYDMCGFITYGRRLKYYEIAERPVYYFETEENIEYVLDKFGIEAILFGNYANAKAESDRLIKYCVTHGVKVLIAPPIDEIVDGKLAHQGGIRDIKIEDLLGREEIKISLGEIMDNFRDKTVLVTGAAGSIGSELCRQLATFGIRQLILFDNAETPMHEIRLEMEDRFPDLKFVPVIGDVRIPKRLDYVFRTYRPQVVFHAAAYKHVPLMEENPCEAVLVNVVGSRNVADRCIRYGVEKMVMISTDKAVNPTNVMGCTKRLAEIYVQSLGQAIVSGRIEGRTQFITTRFGNVLGSNGSVIPRFREQIEHGGPVTVTHPEIRRYFMTIPEACRLVMEAATIGRGNTIFVFDMGECVKIAELARRMIALAGFRVDQDIRIVYTGLRPGEKLYEEVLSNTENTLPTAHEKIRIAKVREYDYEEACRDVEELERLAREFDIPNVVRLMKRIVPEYHSQNSRFEIYDRELEEERTA